MRKILAILALSLVFYSSYAQKADGSITGKLIDTASKQPISDATVSLLQAKDSSLVTFTLTNKQGLFEIKGLAAGNYRLIITHQVYTEIKKSVSLTEDKKQVNVGEINPVKDVKTLEGVVVTNEAPIVVKNDTIQFNASGFRTQPNAQRKT